MKTGEGVKIINRLAHFVPCDVDCTKETKEALVLSVLFKSNNSSLSSVEIIEQIDLALGIKMTLNELKPILKNLKNKNKLISLKENNYQLSPDVYNSIKQNKDNEDELQDKVLNDWVYNEIRPSYSFLTSEDFKTLKKDLLSYLNQLFVTHGIDSIHLIDGKDKEKIEKLLDYEEFDFTFSNRPEIKKIEEVEFPAFFTSNNKERNMFLINLVDKAFRYLTTVCDPEIIENFKRELSGKILYLDSSVVYRLVNLQGEERHQAVKEVVEICHKYKFDLRISRMTLDELQRRLNYDARIIKQYPVKRSLAELGCNYTTDHNYVTTFWRESMQSGISVDDFISIYKNIDYILEEKGITVEREFQEYNENLQDVINKFISKIRLQEDGVPEDRKKSTTALEHDAYNLAYIYQDRDYCKNFYEANSWFLTTDYLLIKMQKLDHELKEKPPLAILPSQLMQILRFVTTSESTYDDTFIQLFANTFRSEDTLISDSELIHKILARISRFDGTKKLAKRVLMDRYITSKFKECKSEGERDELIHDSLIDKAREMEEELVEANSKIEELEAANEELAVNSEKEKELLEKTMVMTQNKLNVTMSKMEKSIEKMAIIFIFGVITSFLYLIKDLIALDWSKINFIIEGVIIGLPSTFLTWIIKIIFVKFLKNRLIAFFNDDEIPMENSF